MSDAPALPGAPFLHAHAGELHLEEVSLAALARAHGTPVFAYSKASILSALGAYQQALSGRQHLVCYGLKANQNIAVIQLLARAGCGFDIVSGGDLERVLAAGGNPRQVVFSGVGKTRAEMRRALEVGIACFNVESDAELDVLSEVAVAMGCLAPVSIRVNPSVDAKTHPYISTGMKKNKFGIPHDQTLAVYRRAASLPGLRVVGIDCHIGSQITEASPYLDAVDRVLDMVAEVEAALSGEGVRLQLLDFGGGLGINYNGETPPDATELWAQILAKLDARGFGRGSGRTIVIEPGRSLVGNAGVCVSEVLYLKTNEVKNFCIIDAAMNDLPRPAMYQAFHRIEPVMQRDAAPTRYDVVGPVCESGDWIGRDRDLAVQQGDLVAVLSAGAYCMSMASNYNTRGRAPEVLVDGQAMHLIRERETVADLLRPERLLP
jgi:diaminopimelate decarboxylase